MATADKHLSITSNSLDTYYHTAFMAIDQGFCLLEKVDTTPGQKPDFRYLLVNPAFAQHTGLQDVVGRTIRQLLPGVEEITMSRYDQVALTSQPIRFQTFVAELDRWIDANAFSISQQPARIAVLFTDITPLKRREANGAFLADIAHELSQLSTDEEIMATVGAKIGTYLGVNSCLFVDVDDARGEVTVFDAWNTVDVPSLRYQTIRLSDFINDEFSQANRTGEGAVVRDTHTDPRGEGKDYTAVGIGAFVTVPFHRHGVWTNYLAVTQSQPRDWREDEIELFRELANRLFPRLERARAETALHQLEERNRIALEAAELGTWEWHLATDEVVWNEQHFRLLGMEPQSEPLTSAAFLSHVHPDDRERITAQLTNTIEHRVPYEAELRVIREDGQTGWMSGYGRVTGETDGKPTRLNGVMFDITNRKEAQEALRQSEERLQLAISGAGIFTWEVNGQSGETISSPNFREVIGFDLATDARENFINIHPDDYDWVTAAMERALGGTKKLDIEHRIVNPQTHETIWVRVQGQPILSDSSQPNRRFIGTTQNTTKHKLAELALQKSQMRLQKAIQIDTVGVLFFDDTGRFLDANDAFLTMTGYRREHFDQQSLTPEDITLPEWMPRTRQAMKELKTTGLATPYEKEFKRPDGSRWWGLTAGTRLSDNENVEFLVDVTQRKQTELELQESEARFRTLTDAVPQVIWTNDARGTATYFNQRWYEYSGLGKEASTGLGWQAIVHPDDAPASVARWQQALAAGEVFDTEYRLRRGDGVYRWFIGRNVPLLDEQRRVLGWFGSATDIEELKRSEEALRQADQRKDEFLAMLAHELRNPLAPIRNVVQILQLTVEDDKRVAPALALMSRQVDHLVRLVDDLLDVSRINRGKIELRRERLELGSLVNQAVESVRPLYDSRHRQLSVQLAASPMYLEGDATRLTQVITNLLTNGARYTGEQGQVWVSLVQTGNEAVLRVADNGIGLAADQLSAIFELFVQVDTSLARSQGGLGLGLTLVKRLVELHGGRVEARSPGVDQGSEFIISLPLLPLSSPSMNRDNQAMTSPAPGHRILVVDDNVDAATTLAMFLKLKKYEVHTGYSGRQALEAGERLRPRVVLLDIGMPDLDGYATARLIRQQPWGLDVALVALTGYGQDEDKQRSQQAGFDGHFVKPVDLAALTQWLTSWLGSNQVES